VDPTDDRTSEPTDARTSPTLIGCDLYRFPVPQGWEYSLLNDDVGLTSQTLPAWIVIYPHGHKNLRDVEADIQQEPPGGDMRLSIEGPLKPLGDNSVVVNLTGTVNDVPAKARLIGTVSPYQGGAFIFAMTSSEESFTEVSNTADAIGKGMQYFEADLSEFSDNAVGKYTRSWRGQYEDL
jgi:hypothetical protein